MSKSQYGTKDDIITAIDIFFETMPETVMVRTKNGSVEADNMTQSALARHLGYKTRFSMDASLRDRGWLDIIHYYRDRFIEYWKAAGMVGDNPTMPRFILGSYGVSDNPLNTRQHLTLDPNATDIEKAMAVLMAGAKGDIEPSVVTSFINSIKATSDIKKTTELEEMVKHLAEIAGLDS
jgi:hypothetical protein